jgi:hypothetical protein
LSPTDINSHQFLPSSHRFALDILTRSLTPRKGGVGRYVRYQVLNRALSPFYVYIPIDYQFVCSKFLKIFISLKKFEKFKYPYQRTFSLFVLEPTN